MTSLIIRRLWIMPLTARVPRGPRGPCPLSDLGQVYHARRRKQDRMLVRSGELRVRPNGLLHVGELLRTGDGLGYPTNSVS